MLKDCIEVFQKELNEKSERLILDSYMPADGTYIIVSIENDDFVIKKENIIELRYDKKKKEFNVTESELNKIRQKDYYSRLITMDKPIDKKKKIHSNSYLSFWVKKESFSQKTDAKKRITPKIIEEYYDVLANPYLKYKDKNSKIIYESIEEELGEIDIEKLNKVKEWVINNIFELASVYTGKDYLKIFFDYPIEEYIRENKRYVIPNIYNKNDYNEKIDDMVLGLPNDNMQLNSDKPYLENKTRKKFVPNLLNTEEALNQRKFFDYLMNFASEGLFNIYIGDEIKATSNDSMPESDFCGNFLRIKKGKQLEIVSFDKIVGYKEVLGKTIHYKNLLDVKIIMNEDDIEYGEYIKKRQIQKIISEVFFSNYLINNYFTESKYISLKNNNVKRNLLIARQGIFNWIYKDNSNGISKLLDKVSMDLIKGSLEMGYMNKANKQFNLRWALKKYFEEGMNMADFIKEVKEKLRVKILNDDTQTISNDEEYCFAVGQLASYFISKSKATKKPQFLINTLINTKSDSVVKLNLKNLYKKYNYEESMNTKRVRNLYSMVLGYRLDSKLNEDIILAGFLNSNLLYEKKEDKDNMEVKNNG